MIYTVNNDNIKKTAGVIRLVCGVLFVLFCFFFSCACFAQNNSEKEVKRIENKL